ncbi:hypothetical protein ACKVMT_07325 [Halobacteriales archaeon Cl-PHB]
MAVPDTDTAENRVDPDPEPTTRCCAVNKELFGVFGDREAFDEQSADRPFDAVVSGSQVTVGLRDPDLGVPGRSAVHESGDGIAAVWGEAFTPDDVDRGAAEWLLDSVAQAGRDGLELLNGSYLAVVDTGETVVVATDQVRSRECFYTTASEVPTFGSAAAAVADAVPFPSLDREGLLEFFHLGVVLGEGTVFEDLHRVPFDGVLTPEGPADLSRFVYGPRDFDHGADLAGRIRRAFDRRRPDDQDTGLFLSAGYDSRLCLALNGAVDRCYTVGDAAGAEARQAATLAAEYEVPHTVFPPDDRYLVPDDEQARCSQGVRESVHVHHAGFDHYVDTDVLFHGLLFDTLLRDYFVPRRSVELAGRTLPLDGLEPDPDPLDALLAALPYSKAGSEAFVSQTRLGPADPDTFVRMALEDELERYADRADAVENRIAVTGIANQPSLSFHDHLADHYRESFVAVDRELVEWHCTTPPAQRTTDTFLTACRRLDGSLLEHRPPDRRFDSAPLSALDSHLRQVLPWTNSPGSAWPDREELAERHGLGEELFPVRPNLRSLRSKHALRVNDVHTWVNAAVEADVEPEELLAAAT